MEINSLKLREIFGWLGVVFALIGTLILAIYPEGSGFFYRVGGDLCWLVYAFMRPRSMPLIVNTLFFCVADILGAVMRLIAICGSPL